MAFKVGSEFAHREDVEVGRWPDAFREAFLKPTFAFVELYLGRSAARRWQMCALVAEWELSDGNGGSTLFFEALQEANEIENEARSERFAIVAGDLSLEGAMEVMTSEEFAEAWGRFH